MTPLINCLLAGLENEGKEIQVCGVHKPMTACQIHSIGIRDQ